MAVDERARHQLHTRLAEVLGPEVTGTLMEYLPPVGWADVATKQDLVTGLDALGHRLDADIADLRTELRVGLAGVRTEMADVRTEMADLRTEMADLRTETQTGLGTLGSELRSEMADLRTEMVHLRTETRTGLATLGSELRSEMAAGQRLLLFGMLTAMFTLAALVWGAVTLPG